MDDKICLISIGLSNPGRNKKLPELYKQALQAMEHKLYIGNECLICYEDIANINNEVWITHFNEQELKECIVRFDFESAKDIINKEFEQLIQNKCTNNDFIRNVCIDLKNILIRTLRGMSIDLYKLFSENIYMFEFVPWCETISQYNKWIQDAYYIVLTGLSDIHNVSHNKEMLKAAEYIKLNYNREITLQEVADYVKKTPNYFSHLFKKEFGISFSEYVNKVRINKAIELIQNTNMLMYEISEKVGFGSYDYFKQVFKKMTGYPPLDFRKANPDN